MVKLASILTEELGNLRESLGSRQQSHVERD